MVKEAIEQIKMSIREMNEGVARIDAVAADLSTLHELREALREISLAVDLVIKEIETSTAG